MASSLLTNPGPHGHNHCPVHPSEPISGMCGCGTFFCRLCSPSTFLCARCYNQQQSMAYTTVHSAAIAHPGWPHEGNARQGHQLNFPLTRRVLIEALILTVLTVVILGLVLGVQNKGLSFGPTETLSSYGINTADEPLQRETAFFQATLPVDSGVATVTGGISYSISAKVESVKAYDDAVSAAVPYDLLLAWGNMADGNVDSKLTWEQADRQGVVSGTLGGATGPDISNSYVISHVSNNHLVPANSSIRTALQTIRPGDTVKIDGRLVDVKVQTDDRRVYTVQTSESRTDQGDGACEIIFVERIKINGKNYR